MTSEIHDELDGFLTIDDHKAGRLFRKLEKKVETSEVKEKARAKKNKKVQEEK